MRTWRPVRTADPAGGSAAGWGHVVVPRAGRPPSPRHDLIGFVESVLENLGPEGRWFHYGVTSCDIEDPALSLQLHHRRSEHWVVVRGVARVTNGEREFDVHPNESTYIPVETRHRLENPGSEPLVIIEVQCGDYLGEDDIVRFDDKYGRIPA